MVILCQYLAGFARGEEDISSSEVTMDESPYGEVGHPSGYVLGESEQLMLEIRV